MNNNFDLRVRAGEGNDTYYVEVIGSPDGEIGAIKQGAPVVDAALLSAWESGFATPAEAQQIGALLYTWLFPGAVQERFATSRVKVAAEDERLRVRLRIEPLALSRLPWELVWNSQEDFLALSATLTFTRYIAEPFAASPLTAPTPLKIAIMLASPTDLPALDVTQEADTILKSFAAISDAVTPTVYPNTTWKTLQKVLADGVDVLHFVGHGGLENEEGYLALESESGESHRITSQKLRTLFRGRAVKIAVLNACQSALPGAQAALMGVAPSLVRSGVPAVVAQQTPVPSEVAQTFAETLYDYLVSGKPLDAAVTEMRLLSYGNNENYAFWGVPVLFMRAPDGQLWQERNRKADTTAKDKSGGSSVNLSDIKDSTISIGTVAGRDIINGGTDTQ